MNNFDAVLDAIDKLPSNTFIPKPKSDYSSWICGWGKRQGEKALVYAMPNHRKPAKPHKKRVTVTELMRAYEVLMSKGEFTRAWFSTHLPDCNKVGACNYTTIGGVFALIGIAEYTGPGTYRKR